MKDFRHLKFWARTHELTLEIYRATRRFPGTETYELRRQLRRAASSIPANIAEGCGKSGKAGDAEFRRFLRIAMGSASELEYQLLLARDLGYLTGKDCTNLQRRIIETKKMMSAYLVRLSELRTEN